MTKETDKLIYDLTQSRHNTPNDILIVHIARDEGRLAHIANVITFFDPKIKILKLPAWDTDPYSRISPDEDIMAQRLATLSSLQMAIKKPAILIISIGAWLQKIVPPTFFHGQIKTINIGDNVTDAEINNIIRSGGYKITNTVRSRGDTCIRGGIVDIFPPFAEYPTRIDRFGDTVDGLRLFDPINQCTVKASKSVTIAPVREVILTNDSIQKFKERYRILSNGNYATDPMYQAIDSGKPFTGMENWLPLFHGPLVSVESIIPKNAVITKDTATDTAMLARISLIKHLYDQRHNAPINPALPYYPVDIGEMFVVD